MSINKAIIMGRVGRDIELKENQHGSPFCNFSVATSKRFKNKSGEQKESTQWHNISVWGTLAKNCAQYLKKGSECYVEGEIETRSWEENGTKKYITEIKAQVVQFLGGN